MRAVQFHEYGGPEVLRIDNIDIPTPAAGEIRIRVHAAGVNGLEWKIRDGDMHEHLPVTFPSGIGGDASGVVDAIGDDVTDVQVGDAVFGSGRNTYADYAILTSWARKPDAVSFDEAAGYPTPLETGIRALDAAGVTAGTTVLINGASGGVGSAALQVALDRGATVIGVAGPSNQDYITGYGATAVVYGDGLADRVRAIRPGGVDAVVDIAGNGIIPELITLAPSAHDVVSIADFSAPKHGARVSTGFGADKTPALREGAELAAAGKFTLPVTGTYALDTVGDAQTENATGHVRGRLIIHVTD